jgi:polysaccharide export outer membrane protein
VKRLTNWDFSRRGCCILLLSSLAYSQTTLNVPSTPATDCERSSCNSDTSREEMGSDGAEDDGTALPWSDNERRVTSDNGSNSRREYPGDSRRQSGGKQRIEVDDQKPWDTNGKSDGESHGLRDRRPAVREKDEKTEFQKQLGESIGKDIEIYGQRLFNKLPTTFSAHDQAPVPAGYTIAPGDKLHIHAWGQIEIDARVAVDRGGQIYLPKVGTVELVGVRYDQLESYLKGAVGRTFRNFQLSVTLGKLHSIQVFVSGAARHPGACMVGPFSTLVSVVFAAGGPTPEGSMRRIQLKRQGKIVTEFDLYGLLVEGDMSKDVSLMTGDVVFLPPVGPRVAVSGSVKVPAIYELLGPTSVKQEIETAGGLSAGAVGSNLKLLRMTATGKRAGEQVTVNEDSSPIVLADGDILVVPPGPAQLDHVVMLRGNVATPGPYPWHEHMKVSELIPSTEALITRRYWKSYKQMGTRKAEWYHEPPTSRKKDQKQRPKIIDKPDRTEDYRTNIVQLATDINWDYATIQRLNEKDLTISLITFNLRNALAPESIDDPQLMDHDVVTIFSQTDLTVPSEMRSKQVRIEGEVNAPGVYRVGRGETLRDLVARAGGLTPRAYLFASDFRREETRKEQQKRLEQMLDEMDKQLRSQAAALPKANAEDRASAQEQLVGERQLMDKLRQTQVTGRIVLELHPADMDISALPDLILEDGDRLLVPPRSATVGVVGAVYNQNSFIYKTGKTVRQYLSQSGGGTRDADRARLFVVRADGSVVSKQMHHGLWTGNFESMRLTPGDSIIMPERIRSGAVLRGIRDWSQVFSQFALGAAALRVVSP